ncbi:MAG TPA: cyclic nucleotide-binding domain-containing protein [Kofleriaceae bacterium]|nr:cyclic nucleotide-binding domain-containing protein [Kofleriaceae bacterium]
MNHDDLRSMPLFANASETDLAAISSIFHSQDAAQGEILCREGEPATRVYLLVEGEVTLTTRDGAPITLRPPAPIGELGALASLPRNATVEVTAPSRLLSAAAADLFTFLRQNPPIGFAVYDGLLKVVTAKIARDQARISDMRENLVATQKAMKALREAALEAEDSPLAEAVFDALDARIMKNRRVNYRVAPPKLLPAEVKIDGARHPVVEISRTHISVAMDGVSAGDRLSGVLALAGPEIPVSGAILRTRTARADIVLDPLIDEYGAALEGYLSRVQMVDFVV